MMCIAVDYIARLARRFTRILAYRAIVFLFASAALFSCDSEFASNRWVVFESGHVGLTCVACSPSAQIAVSGNTRGTLKVWDISSMSLVRHINARGNVNAIVFDSSGKFLASGGDDGVVRLWDTSSWTLQREMRNDAMVVSMGFARGSCLLAAGLVTGQIAIWNVETARRVGTYCLHDEQVTAIAFSPDGRRLVSGSTDGTVKILNLEESQERTVVRDQGGDIYCVRISPDGRTIASGDEDGSVVLTDLISGAERRRWTAHAGLVTGLTYKPDGLEVVTAGSDKAIRFWSKDGRTLFLQITGDRYCPAESLDYASDEETLIVGFPAGLLKRLNPRECRKTRRAGGVNGEDGSSP